MQNIVQIGVFPEGLQARVEKEFCCHTPEAVLADESLRLHIEGLITRSKFDVPQELIARLPKLKIIATSGVGFERIPVKFANDRGVIVTHTPGVLDAAVCELTVGILISLLREIHLADRFVREGKWRNEFYPMTTGLDGKKVGIVGLGRIGQGIAARLVPFKAEILYNSSPRPQFPYRHFADLHEMARAADVLILSMPGGPATNKLIDASVLDALGPEGYLVNIARGSVVDEPALIKALKEKRIKGAALDVFDNEPDINPEFFGLTNVVLAPHIGSATQETRGPMLRLALDNLHAVLGGAPPLTPVKL